MKKIIHKIAGLALGLSLAMGVGVAIASHKPSEVRAANVTLSSGTYVTDHIEWTLDNVVTISQLKGSTTTAVNSSYISAPRIYKGHVLSFVAKAGTVINTISLTYNGTYTGNSMTAGTQFDGTTVTDDTTNVARIWATTSGGTHQISAVSTTGLSAIYIQNVASATNTQLRLTGIAVTYSASTGPVTYSVSYNANSTINVDLTNLPSAHTGLADDAEQILSTTGPDRWGYTFGGWATSPSSTTPVSSVTIDGDNITVYAIWTPDLTVKGAHAEKPYTVAEAKSAIEDGSHLKENYVSAKISSVTEFLSNYNSITYWISDDGLTEDLQVYSGKNLNGANFSSVDDIETGASVVICGTLKMHNTTYEFDYNNYLVSYEAPVEQKYSVTYSAPDKTGGDVPTDSTTYLANASVTVIGNTGSLLKTGYAFAGWKVEGDDTLYKAGDEYTITGDVTFVAQWVTGYKVTYTAGTHGQGSFEHNDQAGEYSLLPFTSLSGITPDSGYRFKNYTVSGTDYNASATIQVSAATSVTVNFEEIPTEVTFDFATLASERNWENGVAYTPVEISPITLEGNGGGNNAKYYTSDTTWRMYTSGVVRISAASGYAVTSVTSNPSKSFTITDGVATFTCPENIKFKSIVVAYEASGVPQDTFTVTYNSNGGVGDMTDSTEYASGATVTVLENTFTRQGYSFAGWKDQDGNAISGSFTITKNTTLYAQWAEEMPEGTILSWSRSGTTDSYTTGYTFGVEGTSKEGFYQDKGSVGDICGVSLYRSTVLMSSSPAAVTITAKLGGGTAKEDLTNSVYACYLDSSGDQIANTSVLLTDTILDKDGTSFSANLSASGITSVYGVMVYHAKEDSYNVRYYSFALTTSDEAPTFSITYDANGGTGTLIDSSSPYESGSTVTVLDNSFTKEGYSFVEWNTAANGSGQSYEEGAQFDISQSVILYAQWEENGGGGSAVAGRAYHHVTAETDLVVGAKYLITSASNHDNGFYAMSTEQKSSNRAASLVTASGDNAIASNDAVQVVTLGGSTGAWTFAVSGGYLYAASSSGNQLKTQTENDANGQWAITFDQGVASIVAQGSNSRKTMQYNYNNGSPLFACYASASQSEVHLYRLDFEATLLYNITCDGNGSHEFASGYTWSDLENVYNDLPTTEQNALKAVVTPEVDSGLERYDYLVAKYSQYTNFIGRDVSYLGLAPFTNFVNGETNTSTIVIVVVAITSITSIGVLLVIKKRRVHQ